MNAVFDIVDLLQLQEIWVRLPIAQAYTRLERRQTLLLCPVEFRLKGLMPRLGQLRNSTAWQTNRLEKRTDPALVPMCAMTDAYLEILFPDAESPALARQQLFVSVYNHFVVSQYKGELEQTCALLDMPAAMRGVAPGDCFGSGNQPLEGSGFWIPVDLTDEIRALDSRYDSGQPDTPATYVIAETFWPLLVKATIEEARAVAVSYCGEDGSTCVESCTARLWQLVELARDWNRSSSVVGLYYQQQIDTERG